LFVGEGFKIPRRESSKGVAMSQIIKIDVSGEKHVVPITVTVPVACKLTGLGISKIYELMREGKITSTMVGRRRLLFYESLERLLRQ
jgi:excisionase family DNA binding protein